MLWFFEREHQALRLETRYDNSTLEYVAIVHWPGGRQQTERFTKGEAFREWLETFENVLEHERWSKKGAMLLPDGWPDKRPID